MTSVMPDPAAGVQSLLDRAAPLEQNLHGQLERLLASPSLYASPKALRDTARLLSAAAVLAEVLAQLHPTATHSSAASAQVLPDPDPGERAGLERPAAPVVDLAAWRQAAHRPAS